MYSFKLKEPFYKEYLDFIVAIVLFILFFFFVMADDIKEEKSLINAWYKIADKKNLIHKDKNISIKGSFILNNVSVSEKFLHYFNKEGDTISFFNLKRKDMAMCGTSNFVLYRKSGVRKYDRTVRFFNIKGNELWTRHTAKYPEISPRGNVLSFHSSENMTFFLVDHNNNVLSPPMQSGDFITHSAFSKNTSDYALSYINGYLLCVYRTGELAFKTATLPSKINIAKSVGISENGSFVACVHGLHPEFISLYDSEGSLLWYEKTGLNRRHSVSIYVSESEKTLIALRDYEIAFRRLSDGKVFQTLSLRDMNAEFSTYMKADIFGDYALISVSKEGESVVTYMNYKQGYILWQKSFFEWVYALEISSLGNEFIITSPKRIYAFKRIEI